MHQERQPKPEMAAAGGRLRALRTLLGFNQFELAELSEGAVAREELSKYERGWHRPQDDKKRVGLARALGLTLDDLHDLMHGALSADAALRRSKRAPKLAS